MKTILHFAIISIVLGLTGCGNDDEEEMGPKNSCEALTACLVGTWNATANFPATGGTVTFAEDGKGTTTSEIFEAYMNDVRLNEFEWDADNAGKVLTISYSDASGGFSIIYTVTVVNADELALTIPFFTEDVITLTR